MQLADLIPRGAETGAGLALEHQGRYLFFLAGRAYASPSGATFYAGIGGHCEPGESWLACAEREAWEELGCQVRIHPAADTSYITRDQTVRQVAVEDVPRPLCVHEIWNPPDAPWNKQGRGYIYYVVVYAAMLDHAVEPQPHDVDAILWLTPGQVCRTAHSPMPLQALLADGATMRAREPLPGDWTVRPFGTARALAFLWGARP